MPAKHIDTDAAVALLMGYGGVTPSVVEAEPVKRVRQYVYPRWPRCHNCHHTDGPVISTVMADTNKVGRWCLWCLDAGSTWDYVLHVN